MEFLYNNNKYEVEVIKKNNKNTYVRVRDNKIYVTTNYFTGYREIEALLNDNHKAIEKMIDRALIREKRKSMFLLFGKYYDIIYGDFERNIIFEETYIKALDEKTLCMWLDQYIHTTFYNHLMYWYDEFEENIPIPTLKIRKMKTRWGVCNIKNKTITLNLELFRYDIECLDYVIIHELSHFIEGNHSRKFWNVVEKYCPDYKDMRKKLKY